MRRILPIKANASIHTECWTYNKLCILETSPYAEAWIASNFCIYMDSNYLINFGRINTTLYLNEYSNILDIKEIDYWGNPPSAILNTIENEISKNNYIIVYLMLSIEKHIVHEFVFYGFDNDKHELYTLILDGGKFKEIAVSYNWFITHFKNLYDYHLYNPDNVAWFGSNFFPITKVKLRDDFNDNICFVESTRRLNEELLGKRILMYNPMTTQNEQYLTGIECINGISHRVKEYIRDKQFIHGDVFKKLSFELRRNICKLYEHQKIVNQSIKWILRQTNHQENNVYLQLHEKLCEKIEKLAMLSIKFEISEDWSLITMIDEGFENLHENMKEVLQKIIDYITIVRKEYNRKYFNCLIEKHPSVLAEREYFKD